MDQKFGQQFQEICHQTKQKMNVLIHHTNRLFLYHVNQSQCQRFDGSMESKEYDQLKEVAHLLVYYSIKHQNKYQKLSDLPICILEKNNLNDYVKYLEFPMEKLMKLSSEIYLEQLHLLTQNIKNQEFGGVWPDNLLILVVGSFSPRFGHPAMQYFSRLCNQSLETLKNVSEYSDIHFDPSKENKKRWVYYLENNFNSSPGLDQIRDLGIRQYVEKELYQQYQSMQYDILSRNSQNYLKDKCQK